MTVERSEGAVFCFQQIGTSPSILDDPVKRAAFLKEARDFARDRDVDPKAPPPKWATVDRPSVLDDPEKMAAFLQEARDCLRDRGVDLEARRKQDREYAEAFRRMHQDRDSLTEAHPYKWAAVGGDGLVALADSMQELLDDMKSRGLDGLEYQLAYLDRDPPILIL